MTNCFVVVCRIRRYVFIVSCYVGALAEGNDLERGTNCGLTAESWPSPLLSYYGLWHLFPHTFALDPYPFQDAPDQ
jgi:hypothetical protein